MIGTPPGFRTRQTCRTARRHALSRGCGVSPPRSCLPCPRWTRYQCLCRVPRLPCDPVAGPPRQPTRTLASDIEYPLATAPRVERKHEVFMTKLSELHI